MAKLNLFDYEAGTGRYRLICKKVCRQGMGRGPDRALNLPETKPEAREIKDNLS